MKGKVLAFALTAVGVLALGVAQKRCPRQTTLAAGETGLAILKTMGKKIRWHILQKSIVSTLLVATAQWLCGKGYEKITQRSD